MEVAAKYLRDTELTVDDIAYSLGFSEALEAKSSAIRSVCRN